MASFGHKNRCRQSPAPIRGLAQQPEQQLTRWSSHISIWTNSCQSPPPPLPHVRRQANHKNLKPKPYRYPSLSSACQKVHSGNWVPLHSAARRSKLRHNDNTHCPDPQFLFGLGKHHSCRLTQEQLPLLPNTL